MGDGLEVLFLLEDFLITSKNRNKKNGWVSILMIMGAGCGSEVV